MREDRERQREAPLPFDPEEARARLAASGGLDPEARVIFLFGSRARGTVRRSSDVDIAVWVDPSVPAGRFLDLRLRWMDRLPDLFDYPGDVDVVVLNEAPPALAWDVARRPVVLWEAERGLAEEVAFRLRCHYRDELPRLERRRERLLRALEEGDFRVRR